MRVVPHHQARIKQGVAMAQPRTVQAIALLLFVAAFQFALYDPPYELHAVIHVVPTWLAVLGLAWSIQRSLFGVTSFLSVILFLVFHLVGTRYIYSYVPYREWFDALTGLSWGSGVGSERNHYDRFVHFAYGVLITPAMAEWWQRSIKVGRWWSHVEACLFVAASSALFEWIEYRGAVALAGEDALDYLGQQGDPWDAQQDMGLAMFGAVITAVVSQLVAAWRTKGTQAGADATLAEG